MCVFPFAALFVSSVEYYSDSFLVPIMLELGPFLAGDRLDKEDAERSMAGSHACVRLPRLFLQAAPGCVHCGQGCLPTAPMTRAGRYRLAHLFFYFDIEYIGHYCCWFSVARLYFWKISQKLNSEQALFLGCHSHFLLLSWCFLTSLVLLNQFGLPDLVLCALWSGIMAGWLAGYMTSCVAAPNVPSQSAFCCIFIFYLKCQPFLLGWQSKHIWRSGVQFKEKWNKNLRFV